MTEMSQRKKRAMKWRCRAILLYYDLMT